MNENELQDNFSGEFTARGQELVSNTAAKELLERFGKQTAAKPTEPAPKKPEDTAKSGILATAGAVAKDVGEGIIEAPLAILDGVTTGAQEVLDLTDSVGDWLNENVIDLGNLSDLGIGSKPKEGDPDNPIQLPGIPDPDSNTGKLIKGIAQFLTGFKGAGKFIKNSKNASRTEKITKAAAKGAASDATVFDPHEQRMSNLIQESPALANPVNAFLAAQDDDSEAEGRFKNALEGLGLGILTDGFVLAAKAMRSSAKVKRLQADADRVAGGIDEVEPELPDNALAVLGDETLDDFIQPRPKETGSNVNAGKVDAAAAATARTDPTTYGEKMQMAEARHNDPSAPKPADLMQGGQEPETFINFSRIDSPDDIKDVIQNMADAFKGDVDKAARGKQTFQQIELNADQVNAFETLQNRREGQPLNAEQSVAVRQLWAASAERLTQTAKLASSEPSEANLFAFRKMVAVHQGIQSEVIAARTETARALASWRIPTGSNAERFRGISQAIEGTGGPEMAREMATRITSLAENGMIHEMDRFIEKSAFARTRDAMLEAWINGLLSGPKTHMVNMLSNTGVVFQQMYERHTAAKIASFIGDEQSVQLGESMAQFHGMIASLGDAFRYAGKSFITGESGFGLGKIDTPQRDAISSEALKISKDSWLGRSVDVLGSAARIPTRALTAGDEFFKTIGYRMELHAQALRQATQDVNSGRIEADQLKTRMAEIIESPPENIKLRSIDAATYQTFTNTPGELTKNISKTVNQYPVLRIILPFIRTPSNLMKYTFQRSPLAPLMKEVRTDVAAGGSRRDLALARIGTGTTIMFAAADLAMNESITGNGPSNPKERQALLRSGWQPYSIKVDDRYFAYNRLDPIGMTIGLGADMVDVLSNQEFGEDEDTTAEEALVAVAVSIGNNTMSKTYMSGLAEFFETMSDPARHGDSYFKRLSGSLVPTLSGEITRFNDPYMREANTMLEAMKKKTPGLSETLPLRRNLWGEPISYQSGLGKTYDMFSPIYSKKENPYPVDKEILRLEANIGMPSAKTGFDGVRVNLRNYDGAYSRFLQLSGNEIKHPAWNLGAREYLNQVIGGRHQMSQVYKLRSDGPDGGKADFIKDTLKQYRELAKDKMLEEYPEIKAFIEDKKEEQLQETLSPFKNFGGVAIL